MTATDFEITPDHSIQREVIQGANLGGIYLDFSAGRRGVNAAECRWCGRHIHQRDEDEGGERENRWYDGEGLFENGLLHEPLGAEHHHEPALEMGPILGPFEGDFVQVTYETIRDFEGEVIAFVNKQGDWQINDPYTGAGECYSDFSIYTADYARSIA